MGVVGALLLRSAPCSLSALPVSRRMRIVIDYTAAVRQRAGVGRYTRGLVQALLRLDRTNQYTLFIAAGGLKGINFALRDQNLTPPEVHAFPLSDRLLTILWHRLRLPLYADVLAGGADLFHSPDFTLPPLRSARGIVTVHDLTFKHYPECAPRNLVRYLNRVVPLAVRRAHLILADSENTKDDLARLLDVPPQKIRVVYAGVGPEFRPVDDASRLADVRARYGLTFPFLLSVGTLEPRKNYTRLLHAFARSGVYRAQPELRLVIVGRKGWLYQEIFETVQRLRLADRVIFPGFIADADLPALYTQAVAFVYPSLYEGFGLPVLEAMACGTPVVCSMASSLPEVAGEAALLVDPLNVDDLAQALERAVTDAALRSELRERGLRQAARFTWEAAARQLLAAYREVVEA